MVSTGCLSEETVLTRGWASLFKCSCEIVLRRSFDSLSDESPFTLGGEDVCPSGLPKRLARDEAVGVSNLSGTQKEEFCDLQSRGVPTLEPFNDSLSSSKPPRRLPIQDCMERGIAVGLGLPPSSPPP